MSDLINTLASGNLLPQAATDRSSGENRIGTLAQLASEMKLIEGLQPIRITGSRPIYSQQAPAQLLEASTSNGKNRFTMINTGTPIDVSQNKTAELALNIKQQTSQLLLRPENNTQLANSLSTSSSLDNQSRPITTSTTTNVQPGQTASSSPQANAANNNMSDAAKMVTHPQTNKAAIQQSITLASEIKTLKVVGNGSQTSTNTTQANNAAATQTQTNNSPAAATQFAASPVASQIRNQGINLSPSTAVEQAVTQANTNQKQSPQAANSTGSQGSTGSQNAISTKGVDTAQPQYINPISTNRNSRAETNTNIPNSNSDTSKIVKNNENALPSQQSNRPNQVNSNSINTRTDNSFAPSINNNQAIKQQPTPATQSFTVTDGKTNFDVQSQKNLPIGSNIQVFVDSKGQFQVLPQNTVKQQPTVVNQALNQSLPQQFSDKELTKAIGDLTTTMQDENTPPKVKAAISQLLQSFPNHSDLKSAEAVKQSLQNSGAFLESNLLNTNTDPAKDIKLNWLKLHSLTQPTAVQPTLGDSPVNIAEQNKLTHHALERITSNQLKNIVEQGKSDIQNSPIYLELPIRDKNTTSLVQFQIEQDSSQPETVQKEKRRWLAKLRFDFPETGKFEARVRVKENQAGIIFVAEQKDTERTIRQNFVNLKEDLEKKDIELEQLDCFCRSLSEEKAAVPSDRLIDVRT